MKVEFRLRRNTAAYWNNTNPILRSGEPCLETDTGKFKIGDGVNNWVDLPYHLTDEHIGDLIAEHVAAPFPHTAYDDGPSLILLYENAKV